MSSWLSGKAIHSTNVTEVQKKNLDTTSSERNWIATVKEIALYSATDVWIFINPDLTSQPPPSSKPTRPIVVDDDMSNPSKIEDFRYELQFYQEDLREYEMRKRVLGQIWTWIWEHISITNFVFIWEEKEKRECLCGEKHAWRYCL